MSTNITTRVTLAALATTVLAIGLPAANHAGESDKPAAADYTKMSPEALAEHLMLLDVLFAAATVLLLWKARAHLALLPLVATLGHLLVEIVHAETLQGIHWAWPPLGG